MTLPGPLRSLSQGDQGHQRSMVQKSDPKFSIFRSALSTKCALFMLKNTNLICFECQEFEKGLREIATETTTLKLIYVCFRVTV